MGVVVVNHITLDGVIQAPGAQDEDTRGGFEHGGWALPVMNTALSAAMDAAMGPDFRWLFGHRTYDSVLSYWNEAGGPFRDGLNGIAKYVASRDPAAELPWPNSTVLAGDVPGLVAALRDEVPGNLVILGSGELVQALLAAELVDELLLLIDPVAVGGGRRLFADDAVLHLFELVSAETIDGLLVARYRTSRSG